MKYLIQFFSVCFLVIATTVSYTNAQTIEQDTLLARQLYEDGKSLANQKSSDAISSFEQSAALYRKHELDSMYLVQQLNIGE